MKSIARTILTLLLAAQSSISYANNKVEPYFRSIKAKEANVRVGPDLKFPIKRKYIKDRIPVKIISHHNNWRMIEDISGEQGWVHVALLSKKRTAFINNNKDYCMLYNINNDNIIAKIESGTVVDLKNCEQKFCQIKVSYNNIAYEGLVKKPCLWGAFSKERF